MILLGEIEGALAERGQMKLDREHASVPFQQAGHFHRPEVAPVRGDARASHRRRLHKSVRVILCHLTSCGWAITLAGKRRI